jgi:aspartokinase
MTFGCGVLHPHAPQPLDKFQIDMMLKFSFEYSFFLILFTVG